MKEKETEIERLNLSSMDIAEEKRNELLRLFPEIRTEGGKIDFEKLKLVLGDVVDTGKERYGMIWPGKAECFKVIQAPSVGTLLPDFERSSNFERSQNIFIEGDSLQVMKLMQKSYFGKVKVIFIDPPYNTGNDFIYPDDFTESLQTYLEYTKQVDSSGKRFGTNTDTEGRFHSKWIRMMYPRLFLARNLLAEDGIIAITIDDNEVFQLGHLMDEIFGSSNRLACAPWLSEASGGKEKTGLRTGHEYVLIYFKSTPDSVTQQERTAGELNKADEVGPYRKGRELMKWGGTSLRSDRPNQFYELPTPDGTMALPYRNDGKEGHWRWGKENPGIIEAKRNPNYFHWEMRPFDENVSVNGLRQRWVPYEKIRDQKKSVGWSTWLDKFGTNADATRELKDLFGEKPFDTPKPVSLIKWFINLHSDSECLVMDFFAGSASTAHAVLELNYEDESNRKFICVQLPEPLEKPIQIGQQTFSSVSEIAIERISRVQSKLRLLDEGKTDPRSGFRVFKLADSCFKNWSHEVSKGNIAKQLELHLDHVKPDRTAEDILYEILLKSGFPLTTKVEAHKVLKQTVYSIADGMLLVCLEDELNLDLIRYIADQKPERVVCLDHGFADNDHLKANAVQIFRTKGITSFKTV